MYGLSNAEITGYTQKVLYQHMKNVGKKEDNTKLDINRII